MKENKFHCGCLDAEWTVEREKERDSGLTATFNRMDEVYEGLWQWPAIKNVFDQLFWEREQVRTCNLENWQELDKEDWRECSEIQKGVHEGYPEVVEILLDEGKVHYRGKEYLLENTMVRLRTEEEFWDGYFLFKNDDRCSARIFIRGWGLQKAFLVVDSETDGSIVFRLSKFYLLGLCNNPGYGMSIYYPTFVDRFLIDAIMGFSLIAVRKMLLEDWLENKWAEAERERKGERNTVGEES